MNTEQSTQGEATTSAPRKSITTAEMEELGFFLEKDELAMANIIVQNYFFQREAMNGAPRIRLNISKNLSGTTWIVTFSDGESATMDLLQFLNTHSKKPLRTVAVKGELILATIDRWIKELEKKKSVDEQVRYGQKEVQFTASKICRNCGRQIGDVLQDYCGEADCEERAFTYRPQRTQE